MKYWKLFVYSSIYLNLALLSGCGGQAYNQGLMNPSNVTSTNTPSATLPDSSASSTTPTLPSISKTFTLQGIGGLNDNYPFKAAYATSVKYENISADSRLILTLKGVTGSSATSGSAILRAQYLDGSTKFTGCIIYARCIGAKVQVFDRVSKTQIGEDYSLSANVTGSGSCGNTTPSPTQDVSSILTSGHGALDIVVSEIQTMVVYNSCAPYSNYITGNMIYLPYNYAQSGTVVIQTDTN